ncbi:MAG: hypothetical protein HFJ41_01635 [Clostridia bacterium]|nr:hypothetical protein [Clostridia bacterium]
MVKSVLKEIIITLVLCIAILLILGIIFYDYNPLSKIVPNKVAYETPEEVKNEIEESEVKDVLEGGINIVYSIDGLDLNIDKKNNSYVPGKVDPFAEVSEEPVTNTNGKPNSGNVTTNTNKNPDSTGKFLNNTGRK